MIHRHLRLSGLAADGTRKGALAAVAMMLLACGASPEPEALYDLVQLSRAAGATQLRDGCW